MKRHEGLAQWSREHHQALVLAKQARAAMTLGSSEAAALIATALRVFRRELEPHFVAEEARLLPALIAAGACSASERVRAEHDTMRGTVGRLEDGGNVGMLVSFGEQLTAHVRFEERELFPLAESLLASATLDTLAEDLDATARGSNNHLVSDHNQELP